MAGLAERVRTSRLAQAWVRFGRSSPTLLAAAVSFNVFFALAPLSLILLSVASLLGNDVEIREGLIEALEAIAPPEVTELATSILDTSAEALAGSEGLVIVGSLIVALYSGSRATVAVARALALIEGLPEQRPFWHRRLTGIALTVVGGAALVLAIILILVGGTVAGDVAEALSASWLDTVASLATIPIVGGALFVYLAATYHWGPPRPMAGAWLAALIGTFGALLISWAFSWFLGQVVGAGVVSAIAALAVLLIWLYLGALVIFAAAFAAGELKTAVTGGRASVQS